MKLLSELAVVRGKDGKFVKCEAYLVNERGGKKVIYIDQSGNEVRREAYSKSQFGRNKQQEGESSDEQQ